MRATILNVPKVQNLRDVVLKKFQDIVCIELRNIMPSEEKTIINRVIENFTRTGNAADEQVKVTNLPQGKTSYVEYVGQDGRSITLDEYHVDGRTIWAGYSSRSGTVYLSPTGA